MSTKSSQTEALQKGVSDGAADRDRGVPAHELFTLGLFHQSNVNYSPPPSGTAERESYDKGYEASRKIK